MNLFENLQKTAGTSQYHAKVLTALIATLNQFNVVAERNTLAEALLRFRIFKDRNLRYNEDDQLLEQFLQMDQHFGKLLQESRNCPDLPVAQRLTDQQVADYNTNYLFHRLWTKAVATDSYDKREWRELEKRLRPITND
jgi:hypothetical protein